MCLDLKVYWALQTGAHSRSQGLQNYIKSPWFKTFLQASPTCFWVEPLFCGILRSWNLPSHLCSLFVQAPQEAAILSCFHFHASKSSHPSCPRFPGGHQSALSLALLFIEEDQALQMQWWEKGPALLLGFFFFLNYVYRCFKCIDFGITIWMSQKHSDFWCVWDNIAW